MSQIKFIDKYNKVIADIDIDVEKFFGFDITPTVKNRDLWQINDEEIAAQKLQFDPDKMYGVQLYSNSNYFKIATKYISIMPGKEIYNYIKNNLSKINNHYVMIVPIIEKNGLSKFGQVICGYPLNKNMINILSGCGYVLHKMHKDGLTDDQYFEFELYERDYISSSDNLQVFHNENYCESMLQLIKSIENKEHIEWNSKIAKTVCRIFETYLAWCYMNSDADDYYGVKHCIPYGITFMFMSILWDYDDYKDVFNWSEEQLNEYINQNQYYLDFTKVLLKNLIKCINK